MTVSPDTAQSLIDELYLMSRAIRVALKPSEEGNLLPGGVGVLAVLKTKGPCRQVDLAGDLWISPSALSRHVTDLVGAGYVSRHADPMDGRATLIQVTDEGRDLLRRIRISRARDLQAVLSDWSDDEAERAREAIHKLRAALAGYTHSASPSTQQPV
ncbi:MarR family winged helix-turn-helix transcriptional regulator [Nocardia sp. CNY236]|uniref:MarR family winged helix-turn-helix transcriptional regulator n=1 Tax=Nocardia sp. CNY236 TaxID=1169152 RepID=UPI0004232E99|nr:MarR family winged helix-turn-helix transcriptional regulator [Nocardia sp. CNY236]